MITPAILFLDLETSGLPPKGAKLPLADPNWPWPTHVAAEVTAEDGTPTSVPQFFSLAILADGRAIQPAAERIHGISSREASRVGIPEISALDLLVKFSLQARRLVTFGGTFDHDVVAASLTRLALAKDEVKRQPIIRLLNAWRRPFFELCDVREICTPICRIEREDGSYKWPSLEVACNFMLGVDFSGPAPHSAFADMARLKALYFALQHRGIAGTGALIEPIIERVRA